MVTERKDVSRLAGRTLLYAALLIGAVLMVMPLYWTVATSLKTIDQLSIYPPHLIPDPVAWWNYVQIFRIQPVGRYVFNSLVVVAAAEFGGVITCAFVAYGFAKMEFPGRRLLFGVLVSTLMMPYVVRLIPLFIIYSKLGWINTFLPVTVPELLGRNAFYILLLTQFFRTIPSDLLDAARIDGAGEFRVWWSVMMPLSRAVLAAVAIFAFQFAWDDFLGQLIYLGGNPDLRTLAVAVYTLRGMPGELPMIHYLMAMSTLMIVPVLAMFAVGQRQFVQGITFTGLRG
jgi:multiple sugar transport system permease protein